MSNTAMADDDDDDDDAHKRRVFSTIKYLDSTHCHLSARTLEKETGIFFNMAYFEHCFEMGFLEEAEDYLGGFLPGIHDNEYSKDVYFELNWHKFMAVLEENDRAEALRIVDEDLRPFERYHPNLIVSASELANLDDFRMHQTFRTFGAPKERRMERWGLVRANLEANPLLAGKIYRYFDPQPPTPPQS